MAFGRAILLALGAACSAPALAGPPALASDAARAFGDHCFSPYLTAKTALEKIARPGIRVDFYDTKPFSSAAASPATGRPATPGTDRRCEVAFDGDHVEIAKDGAVTGLNEEGIRQGADVPTDFVVAEGTRFIAARQLNPKRIAVVQVGLRPGPNGTETFANVERLDPLP